MHDSDRLRKVIISESIKEADGQIGSSIEIVYTVLLAPILWTRSQSNITPKQRMYCFLQVACLREKANLLESQRASQWIIVSEKFALLSKRVSSASKIRNAWLSSKLSCN